VVVVVTGIVVVVVVTGIVVVVVVTGIVVVVVVIGIVVVVVVEIFPIVYVKSSGGQISVLQSGQSGLNILNVFFNILKLCLTSGADNGVTYILN
jgi:hypothetical protein